MEDNIIRSDRAWGEPLGDHPSACAAVSLSTQHLSPSTPTPAPPLSWRAVFLLSALTAQSVTLPTHQSQDSQLWSVISRLQGRAPLLWAGGEGGTPLSSVGSPSQVDTAWHRLQPTWERGRGLHADCSWGEGLKQGPWARLLSPGPASQVGWRESANPLERQPVLFCLDFPTCH